MSHDKSIAVCKRCGIVVGLNLDAMFDGVRPDDYVRFVKCDKCKFSLKNLWNALTKKEESKDE